jgi:hypothetical protein
MEFFAIYFVVNKTVKLNVKLIFGFLSFLLISSFVVFPLGNFARNAIHNSGGHSVKTAVEKSTSDLPQYHKPPEALSLTSSLGNILNRLSLVDYAILLPAIPRDKVLLEKYTDVKYIIKSSINSITPGTPFHEAPLSTSRAINIIYRGVPEDFVLTHGYFTEFWTSFALFFLMFGLLGIPLHFLIGLALLSGYSYISKMKHNYVSFMLIYYVLLVPSLFLFTMGIDHSILTFVALSIQLFTLFILYKLSHFFFNGPRVRQDPKL